MKSIVQNGTNLSLFLVSDETEILLGDQSVTVGDPVEFYISDCNVNNCHVVENLTDPEGWIGHKYLVIDGAWSNNPDWVDTVVSEETNAAS